MLTMRWKSLARERILILILRTLLVLMLHDLASVSAALQGGALVLFEFRISKISQKRLFK